MKRVLVVDDNQLVRRLTQIYLNKYGYEVESCDGPFGALNKVKEFRPDVVLLDVNMPGLSGGSLARLLADKKETIGFNILLFSSEDEEILKEIVDAGHADGYFRKNHSFDGLLDAIQETGWRKV